MLTIKLPFMPREVYLERDSAHRGRGPWLDWRREIDGSLLVWAGAWHVIVSPTDWDGVEVAARSVAAAE